MELRFCSSWPNCLRGLGWINHSSTNILTRTAILWKRQRQEIWEEKDDEMQVKEYYFFVCLTRWDCGGDSMARTSFRRVEKNKRYDTIRMPAGQTTDKSHYCAHLVCSSYLIRTLRREHWKMLTFSTLSSSYWAPSRHTINECGDNHCSRSIKRWRSMRHLSLLLQHRVHRH